MEIFTAALATAGTAGLAAAGKKASEVFGELGANALVDWVKSIIHADSDRQTFVDALRHDYEFYSRVKPLETWPEAVPVQSLFWIPNFSLNGTLVYHDGDQLAQHQFILFEGLAGQGKSLLLRYLFACTVNKIHSGSRIVPLIIPHEELLKNSDLDKIVKKRLQQRYQISKPEKLLRTWKNDQIELHLFLDDLHKLEDCEQGSLYEGIAKLSGNVNVKIFAGARPGSTAGQANCFTNVTICQFANDDLTKFLRQLNSVLQSNESNDLFDSVLSNLSPKLRDHLVSPFVATLLYVTYRATNKIPDTIVDLYDQWFGVIARGAPDPDHLVSCARQLAFHWFGQEYRQPISERWATKGRAIRRKDFDEMRSVGLLVNADMQPNRFVFCHERVAEYLAASYISDESDESAGPIYKQMSARWLPWSGVLSFLYEMDYPRLSEWFLRDDLLKLADSIFEAKTLERLKLVDDEDVSRFLKMCTISRAAEELSLEKVVVREWEKMGWWARRYRWYEHPRFYELLQTHIDRDKLNAVAKTNGSQTDPAQLDLTAALKAGAVNVNCVKRILQRMLKRAQQECQMAKGLRAAQNHFGT